MVVKRNGMSRYGIILFLLSILSHTLIPQALPITIDGEFDDWHGATLLFESDVHTTAAHEGLAVKRLWGAHDDRFLFLRIELDREITLLENNPLVLLLDTDNDRSTGYESNTTGAELLWEFGERRGTFYTGTTGHSIRFRHIRLRTAPTVSSAEFEIALGRDALPADSIQLFQSDTVGVYVAIAGDIQAAGMYIFDPEDVPSPEPIPLERFDQDDLRVLAFNAWDDKLFVAEYTDQYRRILNALDPDIIAFQEIWDHDARQTSTRIEELLPGGERDQWHAVKLDRGNVTVSRFPILDAWHILSWSRMTATLIDTRERYGTNLLLVNVHFRCCAEGENNRWLEIEALRNFIDDAREPGGDVHLEAGTPIILAGDFNLVGSSGQLTAIETTIRDRDGNAMQRVRARQTEKRMHYTWRNDMSSFSPGKLDYIFYSGSVLTLRNHYTLQVEEMSEGQRTAYGLQFGDTRTASDHLPHVADFTVHQPVGVRDTSIIEKYTLEQNYPNPFNPETSISYSIPEKTAVTITLFDSIGRTVATIVEDIQSAGRYTVRFDASDLAGGVYFYTLKTGTYRTGRKMLVVR
jgi:endonuclease/exonuclease/phosphatase family metal-dependent hydrolase